MPAILANAKEFLLTTDYPTDKVSYKTAGSTVVPTAVSMSDTVLVTIPHGLGYAPLCIGTFSEASDFSVYYEFGNSPYFYNSTFAYWGPRISVVVESDAINVYVYLINFDSSRTIYYRITGLVPSGVTSGVPLTTNRGSFQFNTDNNYLKVHLNSIHTGNYSGGAATVTIPHDLGYRPMAFVFSELSGRVRRSGAENAIGVTGVATTSYVDSVNLYVIVDSFASSVKLHYRVYLDD